MTFKLIMKNLTYTTLLLAFLLVKTLQNGVADRMDEPMPVVRIFYDFLSGEMQIRTFFLEN